MICYLKHCHSHSMELLALISTQVSLYNATGGKTMVCEHLSAYDYSLALLSKK